MKLPKTKDEKLLTAIRDNNISAVIVLLNDGADVNYKNGTPLETAISCNCIGITKFLVNAGANPLLNNCEAIHGTVVSGNIEIIKFLYNTCGNIDWHMHNDKIFVTAVKYGYTPIISFLISNLTINTELLTNALLPTVRSGNLLVLKLLINNGADFTENYENLLRIAIDNRKQSTAKFLKTLK